MIWGSVWFWQLKLKNKMKCLKLSQCNIFFQGIHIYTAAQFQKATWLLARAKNAVAVPPEGRVIDKGHTSVIELKSGRIHCLRRRD